MCKSLEEQAEGERIWFHQLAPIQVAPTFFQLQLQFLPSGMNSTHLHCHCLQRSRPLEEADATQELRPAA
jgi:hypothetical protein